MHLSLIWMSGLYCKSPIKKLPKLWKKNLKKMYFWPTDAKFFAIWNRNHRYFFRPLLKFQKLMRIFFIIHYFSRFESNFDWQKSKNFLLAFELSAMSLILFCCDFANCINKVSTCQKFQQKAIFMIIAIQIWQTVIIIIIIVKKYWNNENFTWLPITHAGGWR
jgi:hypothetical protein